MIHLSIRMDLTDVFLLTETTDASCTYLQTYVPFALFEQRFRCPFLAFSLLRVVDQQLQRKDSVLI